MDFVSNKIEELEKEVEERKGSQDYDLMKKELSLLRDIAGKQDLQTVKIDELEEELEYLTAVVKDMQNVIIEVLGLDDADKEEHECDDENCHCHDHECDCHDHNHIDSFYTLQCPFCEELFAVENEQINEMVECPFCQKEIKAKDNIVKH